MRNNNEKFQIKSAAEILVCYSTNLLNSLLSLAKPYPGAQLWYTLTIFFSSSVNKRSSTADIKSWEHWCPG